MFQIIQQGYHTNVRFPPKADVDGINRPTHGRLMLRPISVRALILAGALLGLAMPFSAAPGEVSPSWCALDFPGSVSEWREQADARPVPVLPEGLAGARRRLRYHSVLLITRAEARQLTGTNPDPGNVRLYLVRSGIYASPSATNTEYLEQARIASRRIVSWNSRRRSVLIHTFQIFDQPRTLYQVPVIVNLRVRPVMAEAICQTLH
jgi:hypothetical protein